jgi:hypothetical protein
MSGPTQAAVLYPAHISRVTIVVWERGLWGRAEITVEERRGSPCGKGAASWLICNGSGVWSKRRGEFIWPHGETQWASCRYQSSQAAWTEAQRAAAHIMKHDAAVLAKYDAEEAG